MRKVKILRFCRHGRRMTRIRLSRCVKTIDKAMHGNIHLILAKKPGISNEKRLPVQTMYENNCLSAFPKIFQVHKSDSIMLTKIVEVARFKRFEAACILCFPSLAWSLLLGLSFSRCHTLAHHTVCDGVVYQYMA